MEHTAAIEILPLLGNNPSRDYPDSCCHCLATILLDRRLNNTASVRPVSTMPHSPSLPLLPPKMLPLLGNHTPSSWQRQEGHCHCLVTILPAKLWEIVSLFGATPSYANIFMDSLKRWFLKSEPLQPALWKCYINDILCVWSGSRESLAAFLHRLNSCHPTIHFTWTISMHGVSI